MKTTGVRLAALLLSIALVASAWLMGQAILDFKRQDRYVTVKGLAEKEVRANLAIWPITFRVNANELTNLQAELEKSTQIVTTFLEKHGFSRSELKRTPPNITDHHSNFYGDRLPPERFSAQRSVTLQTGNIDAVLKALESATDLLGMGVVLAENYSYNSQTQFLYTGLNDIKPEMIAQATANAREAAEQFANDSGSNVSSIRSANQGLFTIEERDSNSPDIKVVRVVSTVQYYLED